MRIVGMTIHPVTLNPESEMPLGTVPTPRKTSIGLLAVLSILALGCSEMDIRENYYENMAEARSAGALEAGWIPDIIPPSSTEIHERHDVDSEETWVTFSFSKNDMQEMASRLEQVNVSEVPKENFTSSGDVDWWPRNLRSSLRNSKGRRTPLEIYKYNRMVEFATHKRSAPCFVVIDWDSNLAYFWNLSGATWVRVPK
jgi:hypothetical protein